MEITMDILPLIIASCALFVSVWSVRSTQKHNKLSSRPHLTGFQRNNTLNNKKRTMVFEIWNKGTGPAFIKEFSILFDGKEIEDDVAVHIRAAIANKFGNILSDDQITNLGETYAIQTNEMVEIFSLSYNDNSNGELTERLLGFLDKYDLNIKYESMYRESFLFSSLNDA